MFGLFVCLFVVCLLVGWLETGSSCGPSWPVTGCVDQADLNHVSACLCLQSAGTNEWSMPLCLAIVVFDLGSQVAQAGL